MHLSTDPLENIIGQEHPFRYAPFRTAPDFSPLPISGHWLFARFDRRTSATATYLAVRFSVRNSPSLPASSVRETADRFDEKIDEQARTQRKLAAEWV
jgi:hypothetical protein